MNAVTERVRVATLAELQSRGVVVVAGAQRRIAVFADGDTVFAVDNNCPHMGFPLDRGSVRDGILTCHWHQARFDLASGCTFDLWADDVARYETFIEDGHVFVASSPFVPMDEAWHRKRLRRGIEQNVSLVQAKSLLALLGLDGGIDRIVAEVVGFAGRNLQGASEGLTRLGCVANLFPDLRPETAYVALHYAVRQIAAETSNVVPRRDRQALASVHDLPTLARWLRQWVMTRHRDGAERTLLTGAKCLADAEFAELVFGGAAERLYANGGHLLEDCNKAFEYAERLGRDRVEALFALTIPSLTGARGQEESTNWHHPIEIVEPIRVLEAELPALLASPRRSEWAANDAFMAALLGDDPIAVIEVLKRALADGAPAPLLARQVAYGAALRLARFAISNEVTDWFNPQHTFIHANAAHRAVQRSATPSVVRAIFHGAISVYHDRFLNVPPARLPEERNRRRELPRDAKGLGGELLGLLDMRGNIDDAADVVACWLESRQPFAALVDVLVSATVREDLDFHSLQVLTAAVQQARSWGEHSREAVHVMVGAVRNLAAHCPTRRAGAQTAEIAARLHRGERIHEA